MNQAFCNVSLYDSMIVHPIFHHGFLLFQMVILDDYVSGVSWGSEIVDTLWPNRTSHLQSRQAIL